MHVNRDTAHALRVGGQGSYGKRQNWDCYEVAIPVLTPTRETKRQNGRRMKEQGEARFTLTAQDQHGVYNGSRIRRLMPVECERLQGLPDQYTALGRYGDEVKEVSDTQRYKGLGNAFTVNVIEAIVGRMLEKGCLK